MVSKFIPNHSFTVSQRFFAEKLLELVHRKTLDSYRVRLHNPKSILSELAKVLSDFKRNKIKSFEITVAPVILEAIKIINQERGLCFDVISKPFLIKALNEAISTKKIEILLHSLNLLINSNQNYAEKLIDLIYSEITEIDTRELPINAQDFSGLNTLCDYFISELLQIGFAKNYLHQLFWKLFKENGEPTFDIGFRFINNLTKREEESYDVIFRFTTVSANPKLPQLDFIDKFLLNNVEKNKIKEYSADSGKYFLKDSPNRYYLKITCSGLDYISVIGKAKTQLNTILDYSHIGFPELSIHISNEILVIGTLSPEKSKIHRLEYRLDGNFKNSKTVYDSFTKRLQSINQNPFIANETKNKLYSAFRNLRLGWEASEMEQKFLHYWIGMEYLFANADIGENTVKRMKDYFVKCDVVYYTRRNFYNFHQDIQRLDLSNSLPNYDDEGRYISDKHTFDYIEREHLRSKPLLAFRANRYGEKISKERNLKESIVSHKENLEYHLARIYRIRNEIIHEAAIHMEISTVTSNVRYYLVFILNLFLDYFSQNPIDIDGSGQITIDDCLLYYEIQYKLLELNSFKFTNCMNVKGFTEVFM